MAVIHLLWGLCQRQQTMCWPCQLGSSVHCHGRPIDAFARREPIEGIRRQQPCSYLLASGLKNNDPISVLSGALATTATTYSNVGSYAFALGTLTAGANYNWCLIRTHRRLPSSKQPSRSYPVPVNRRLMAMPCLHSASLRQVSRTTMRHSLSQANWGRLRPLAVL